VDRFDEIDGIVDQAADWLRELEPDTIAVVLAGSYARGAADEHSDLDVRAITDRDPRVAYRTWFAERPGRGPLHVSLGARSLADWLAASEEPAWWALGFPFLYRAEYVWATPEARARLGPDPSILRPAGPPQLEALVEVAAKVQRARVNRDPAGVRLYARKLAELSPCLLTALNEPVVVETPRAALDAARSLRVAPEHYGEDLSVCVGLTGTNDEDVGRAGERLARELLAFLRERKPDVDLQPDLARYLADGTLERRLGFLD
jgi:phosphoribosyl-AMP cyclohydrolase